MRIRSTHSHLQERLFVSHYLAGLAILLVPVGCGMELLLALVARLRGIECTFGCDDLSSGWAIQIIFSTVWHVLL